MTTLNTIIEEEKPDFHMIALAKSECAKNAGELTVVRLGYVTQLLEDVYTTAMQRAYEAGANNERASWLRSEIEKLESEIAIHKQLASEWTGIDLKNYTLHRINPHKEQVDALTSIITRYKEELLELEKGV